MKRGVKANVMVAAEPQAATPATLKAEAPRDVEAGPSGLAGPPGLPNVDVLAPVRGSAGQEAGLSPTQRRAREEMRELDQVLKEQKEYITARMGIAAQDYTPQRGKIMKLPPLRSAPNT